MNIRKMASIVSGASMLVAAAAMLAVAQDVPAPSKGGKASPHVSHTATIGGKKITIVYGRPSKKERKIFGGLEPYGKVWRTGADEATTFTTEGDLMLGSLHVEKGKYSLFTIPNEKEWTLILNKVVDQWGAFKYDQASDYGRTTMKVSKPAFPVEQLTITVTPKGTGEGELKIAWDDVVAVAPIVMH